MPVSSFDLSRAFTRERARKCVKHVHAFVCPVCMPACENHVCALAPVTRTRAQVWDPEMWVAFKNAVWYDAPATFWNKLMERMAYRECYIIKCPDVVWCHCVSIMQNALVSASMHECTAHHEPRGTCRRVPPPFPQMRRVLPSAAPQRSSSAHASSAAHRCTIAL